MAVARTRNNLIQFGVETLTVAYVMLSCYTVRADKDRIHQGTAFGTASKKPLRSVSPFSYFAKKLAEFSRS